MKTALVWFRKDLRIRFNEALEFCAVNNLRVIPVYVSDNSNYPYSPVQLSSFRQHFLHESLEGLNNHIVKLGGSGLVYKEGLAEEHIPAICRKYQIEIVLFATEPGWYEQLQEAALKKTLIKAGIAYKLFYHNYIFRPESLPFNIGQTPRVFTEFRKLVEPCLTVEVPETDSQNVIFATHDESTYALSSAEGEKNLNFKGGETAAAKRLNYYLFESRRIETYKETRNGLLGTDYSSGLSPWLANGCLSVKETLLNIKQYEKEVLANESTYWLVFELLWREYFRWIMAEHGRLLFLPEGLKGNRNRSKIKDRDLERWITAQTGEPFIDAAMTELNRTGFLSNRARQNVASFLVHDLNQNWIEGARYFEHLLVDFDVSSNYGNWAYIAGVGNDPRPNRRFNPVKQAGMYDPEQKYVRFWLK
ncbi:MAG: DASH family cryptochrome [Bacteroidia bacterium]